MGSHERGEVCTGATPHAAAAQTPLTKSHTRTDIPGEGERESISRGNQPFASGAAH